MSFLDLPPATRASGNVLLPGSKSISNRTLLLAALASGTTRLDALLDSDDTRVMRDALQALGVPIESLGSVEQVKVTGVGQGRGFPVKRAAIFLGNSGAILSHNDYGTRGGATPASEISNLSVNPKFVDAAGGDFHLAGDSPLLGYGLPQGTITDLDGNPYPVSGKIDLGAYAETIFIDGFDGG